LAALNEKNVEYEFVFVNLMKGEQKLPSFLELQVLSPSFHLSSSS
jgi:glutathione S-transferase